MMRVSEYFLCETPQPADSQDPIVPSLVSWCEKGQQFDDYAAFLRAPLAGVGHWWKSSLPGCPLVTE